MADPAHVIVIEDDTPLVTRFLRRRIYCAHFDVIDEELRADLESAGITVRIPPGEVLDLKPGPNALICRDAQRRHALRNNLRERGIPVIG